MQHILTLVTLIGFAIVSLSYIAYEWVIYRRKVQAFNTGFYHGFFGVEFAAALYPWEHPYRADYRQGYRAGSKDRIAVGRLGTPQEDVDADAPAELNAWAKQDAYEG